MIPLYIRGNNMRNLIDGVFLKSYDIWLMFEWDYNVLVEKLDELNIPKDISRKGYCTLKSKIFDDADEYFIGIKFSNGQMDSLAILPMFCIDSPQKTYKHIQQCLVKTLGHPQLWYLFDNWLSPNYKKNCWRRGRVQIIHTLYERFVFEDVTEIKLNK